MVDIDIAVPIAPEAAMARLKAAGLKVVETGLEHGTVTAIVGRHAFEVTSLRKDVETDGRRASHADAPVIRGEWLEPGMHVISIGGRPDDAARALRAGLELQDAVRTLNAQRAADGLAPIEFTAMPVVAAEYLGPVKPRSRFGLFRVRAGR